MLCFLTVLCVVLGAAVFWLRRHLAQLRGWNGERIVANRLREGLPEPNYFIFNNVYLPTADGTTTQIDHVVVSEFGVFVVETKNYSGWIFASSDSKVWTETFPKSKHTFQNPLRQNYRHVCAIAENLGLPKDFIRGVVAFTGGEFKTEMPPGVVYARGVVRHIRSFETCILKRKEVAQIVAAISEWDATVSKSRRKAHVANLKARYASASADAPVSSCPVCGGEMRLRHQKADGKSFYGCRKYPDCRGIVDVEGK